MALVKYNDNSISTISSAGQLATGSLVPIKTLTASSSSSLSFVHGSNDVILDSTYPIYKFEFINCHPDTDGVAFKFQANAVGGSGYNETITSTFFRAYHGEGAEGGAVAYETGSDLAQSTNFQRITEELIGSDNDQCMSGYLHLFNPSSTTFVKHFMSDTNAYHALNYSVRSFMAGYFNTTSAIDEIQFKMSSGNIDAGKIKLYGIKDS